MKRAVLAIVVVLALGGLSVALVARTNGSSPAPGPGRLTARQRAEQRTAKTWSTGAQAALQPLVEKTPELIGAIDGWLAGTQDAATFASTADQSVAAFTSAEAAVERLPPFPSVPLVNDTYRRSTALYREWGRVAQTLVSVPPGDLRTQVGTIARRVRELADRVFDQGQDEVNARLHNPTSPDVIVKRPLEVPNWAAEGLEAGPPLAPPTTTASGPLPVREGARPTQARSAWAKAVGAAALPGPRELAGALTSGDAGALGALAARWEAVAAALDAVPDPVGGRGDADRVRLAVLLQAEAARAAQAATFLSGAARAGLTDVARAVGATSDGLWPRGLADHRSGLPAGG